MTKCAVIFFIFIFSLKANAQEYGVTIPRDSIKAKHKYSFLHGFEQPYIPEVDPTQKRKGKYPAGGIFSGSIGLQSGRLVYYDNDAAEDRTRFRASLVGSFNIHIYKELVLSTTFFYNINPKGQPPLPIWSSDMHYALKWSNWRPYTFSFGYENYADNRYNEPIGKWGEKFLQGYVFTSFNANLPQKWINKFRLDQSTNFLFIPAIKYFPTYRNKQDEILNSKLQLSLAARYTIWMRLYLEAGVYAYPIPHTRMPWDPDFTYGFGYFDSRPWRVSVTYGNWIANRFNFKKELPKHNFLDGNFSVLFNYRF